MRIARSCVTLVLGVLATTACTGSDDGNGSSCVLDGTERQIIEEVVFEIILNGHTTASHNVGTERAWGFSLPASTVGNNGFFFDVAPCTAPTTLAPYCFAAAEPDPPAPFFEEHDACVRLGCEAADVALIDAYFTIQPQMEPEPRHAFAYDTDLPEGTAQFAENPWVQFRVELVGSASNRVSASFDFDATVDPDGHGEIPLAHSGTMAAETVDLTVASLEVALDFPDLAGGVVASYVLGSGGSISAGGAPVATILDEPAPFVWTDGCD